MLFASNPLTLGEAVQRRAHVFFSAMLGVLTGKLLAHSVTGVYVGLVVAMIAGTFPDLDLGYKHRAALHNLFACLVSSLPIYFVASLYSHQLGLVVGASFVIGFLGHIFLDMLTIRGVALFYPFSSKRYRLARLRSNSRVANIVIEIASLLLIIVVFLAPIGW